MKKLMTALALLLTLAASAQVSKVSLQASGLTCSMCSKAVKNALEKVAFVDNVQVDIKNQQYSLTFKPEARVDPDALQGAVEEAGFSVARMVVEARLSGVKLEKDAHVRIGDSYYHFLNAAGQQLDGTVSFAIVDRKYVPAKEFKKYSGMSRMSCVQTGRSAACCTEGSMPAQTRIYHAVI